MERANMWNYYSANQLEEVEALCKRYKGCLNDGKTERECVKLAVHMAEKNGYKNLQTFVAEKDMLKPGDRVYAEHMGKAIALFQIGKASLEKGMNILGAHIDSPRIDIKQNPLYEDSGMAYLDTHYYGGIKKYQWVTIPLAVHGVVARTDGTVLDIVIGEDEEDPVFVITDLLIHIAQKQLEKKCRYSN